MKTRYGRPVYTENPFLEGLKGKLITRDKKDTQEIILNGNDGDITLSGTATKVVQVSSLSYLQVTDDWIDCMLDFASNGNVAVWVTLLFMYEINHNAISKDHIFIPYDRMIEISKSFNKPVPSKATVSRGQAKMYDRNMIANHFYGTSWFWFNPCMMFNGNIKKIL